jgi:hypothetical protein
MAGAQVRGHFPMRIIPAGLTFEQALARGYAGRIECRPYLDWLKTLPCDCCGAPPPSDPSHIDNHNKGMGTKTPDLWAIPECRRCHEVYEHGGNPDTASDRRSRAALYLLQAFFEGRLVFK